MLNLIVDVRAKKEGIPAAIAIILVVILAAFKVVHKIYVL